MSSKKNRYPAPSVAQQLLSHLLHEARKQPGAILLKGEWGVGKTYLWKTHVATALRGHRYLYVSLFGIGNVSELRSRLMTNLVGEMANDTTGWKGAFDVGTNIFKNLPKILAAGAKGALERKFGKDVLSYLEGLHIDLDPLQFFPSDVIICFDDLERKQLPDDELLGMVNSLIEQKNARVLLIANETLLSESFKKFKEKVVWLTVKWETPPNEVFESFVETLATPKNSKLILNEKVNILECFENGKHPNLRTLQRLIRLLDQLLLVKGIALDSDRIRFLTALVIEDAKTGGLQRAADLYNGSRYIYATFAGKKKPEELTGDDKLSYDFYNSYFEGKHNTGFSKTIHNFVFEGLLNEKMLVEELCPPDVRDEGTRLAQTIQEGGWFFGTEQNANELVDQIVSVLTGNVSFHIGTAFRLRVALHRICLHLDRELPDVHSAMLNRISERSRIPDTLDSLERGFDNEKEKEQIAPYIELYNKSLKGSERQSIKTSLLDALSSGREADLSSSQVRHSEVVLEVLRDAELLDAADKLIISSGEVFFRFYQYSIKRALERMNGGGSEILPLIRARLESAKGTCKADKSATKRVEWLLNSIPKENG